MKIRFVKASPEPEASRLTRIPEGHSELIEGFRIEMTAVHAGVATATMLLNHKIAADVIFRADKNGRRAIKLLRKAGIPVVIPRSLFAVHRKKKKSR